MVNCEKCNKPLSLMSQKNYKGKIYCVNCVAEIKANEKIKCDGCNIDVDPSQITEYYKKNYCEKCLEEEKEVRRKKSESRKDEKKSEENSALSPNETDAIRSNIDHIFPLIDRLRQLEDEQKFLKDLILQMQQSNTRLQTELTIIEPHNAEYYLSKVLEHFEIDPKGDKDDLINRVKNATNITENNRRWIKRAITGKDNPNMERFAWIIYAVHSGKWEIVENL